MPVPENPKLKEPGSFTLIGRGEPNAHNHQLCAGSTAYSINHSVPEMVHAALLRCPTREGKLKSFDDRACLKIPGVSSVIPIEEQYLEGSLYAECKAGLAVIADSTWAAFQGKAALVAEWDEGEYAHANLDTIRKRCQNRDFIKSNLTNDFGDAPKILAQSDRIYEADYETHFQPHICMEPLNAIAKVEGASVEIWTSTQTAKNTADDIAQLLEVPVGNVTVHSLAAGGSFGRRACKDFVFEAVLIAQAIGRPVKVTWTREDDIQHDYLHPYEKSQWKACLDDSNFIAALANEHAVVGKTDHWWLPHWAYLPYGIKNNRVLGNLIKEPVATGAWRSVTEHLGAFSEESFIDELAHSAKEDPYQFRLKHARRAVATFEGDDYWRQMTERALRVFEAVPRFVDWDKPLPSGRGRGLAISKFGSTVALQIAEVSVSPGNFVVDKVIAIVAPGIVVNPQLAENQIEGAIIWALSALKYGHLTLEKGRIQEDNFDSLELIRINETPELEVHFLEDNGPMGGMGELGVPALAPAVLNAIFKASGKRLRSLPVDRSQLA